MRAELSMFSASSRPSEMAVPPLGAYPVITGSISVRLMLSGTAMRDVDAKSAMPIRVRWACSSNWTIIERIIRRTASREFHIEALSSTTITNSACSWQSGGGGGEGTRQPQSSQSVPPAQ